VRGIAIVACDPERARALLDDGPAVRAGWFSLKVLPWLAPRGAVTLSAAPFPRSSTQAVAG